MIGAATSTVVASAGISATTLGVIAGGVGVAAAAGGGSSGGSGGGDGDGGLQGQDGTVRVNLNWSGTTDLDLSVRDPCGFLIDFGNDSQTCGNFTGSLDVDANVRVISPDPQENIAWPDGAPAGTYVVSVNYFGSPEIPPPSTSFVVTVTKDFGATTLPPINGTLNRDDPPLQFTFDYP